MRNYEEIENLSSSIAANGTVILIRLLIALIILGIFDVRMILAMFIVIPLAVPIAVISYKRVAHTSTDLIAIQQKTTANVIEYAGGITTLQAYHRAGSAFAGLKESFARLRDDSKRQEKAGGAISMYGRAILFLCISIVMGFGAYLLSIGEISPFFYIMCLLAALQVYEPIMQLFVFIISMARINQCVEKLSALKEEKELAVSEPPKTSDRNDISFRNVHFAYDGKEEVIRGISFSIPERSLTALVGSSGSGKTTIARLLARFWDIQSGKIWNSAQEIIPQIIKANQTAGVDAVSGATLSSEAIKAAVYQALAGSVDSGFFESGTGSEADPYIIKTVSQLTAFAESVDSGKNYAGQYIALDADLDLTDAGIWNPIGAEGATSENLDKIFAGTFDGRNHKISGLTIKTEEDAPYAEEQNIGLFSTLLSTAKVTGIQLENVNIQVAGRKVVRAGGITGDVTKAIEETAMAWRKGFRYPCIVSPCGGGKSVITAEMPKRDAFQDRKNM